MNIIRTYPQPDSPKLHLGARERALNTFKYLLDMEPEVAMQHPRFAVMVHAFEQSEKRGWNKAADCCQDVLFRPQYVELDPSYCDELSKTLPGGEVRVRKFENVTPDTELGIADVGGP